MACRRFATIVVGLLIGTGRASEIRTGNSLRRVPIIDVSPLLHDGEPAARAECISAIGEACIEVGFFYISGHGVSEALQEALETSFRQFVALPREVKRKIEMAHAGTRWRGYFEVGEEHTAMVVDQKEGLYFAAERPDDARPLHGANLFPSEDDAPGLRDAVLDYMAALKGLSHTVLMAIGEAIGLPSDAFAAQFADPTTLFRCFHYPPHSDEYGPDSYPVGEVRNARSPRCPRAQRWPPRSRGCIDVHVHVHVARHSHMPDDPFRSRVCARAPPT